VRANHHHHRVMNAAVAAAEEIPALARDLSINGSPATIGIQLQ